MRSTGVPIKVIFRHAPSAGHPSAIAAARAAECADSQGEFEAMHDALFAFQDSIGKAPWHWFARIGSVSLDRGFDACVARLEVIPRLHDDTVDARRLGVLGTPTLLIGRIRHDGLPSLDSLRAYVRRSASPSP
ncbi:MAG: thioredoxin domain-containing protein [Gemmatimonadaceae bacterium]|nr:thioredoxin domain-containing protein [Gemmatimonadaceae bacterium]